MSLRAFHLKEYSTNMSKQHKALMGFGHSTCAVLQVWDQDLPELLESTGRSGLGV